MRPYLAGLTILLIAGCQSAPDPLISSEDRHKRAVDALETQKHQAIAFANSVAKEERIELTKLLTRFEKVKASSKETYYRYRNAFHPDNEERSFIALRVRPDGTYYMVSQYFGAAPVFHERIEVRVGTEGAARTSPTIPLHSAHNTEHTLPKGTLEEIDYQTGDNGIPELVATNADKDIYLRFIGKKASPETIIPKSDQVAMKDGLRLSHLLGRYSNKTS